MENVSLRCYESPVVTTIIIEVEKGFAQSEGTEGVGGNPGGWGGNQ